MTHVGYLIAAYGITFVILAALIIWIVVDRRAQKQALMRIDARRVPSSRDVNRRSTPGDTIGQAEA